MAQSIEGTLVLSSNRGRYAIDDPEGYDITSGEHIAISVGGVWIEGHVEHSSSYEGSGCYAISDTGRKGKGKGPQSQVEFEAMMTAQAAQGKSLADALSTISGTISDVFCGYYFIANDGNICGLCTGMKIRYYRL